jgi:hypothetical protein
VRGRFARQYGDWFPPFEDVDLHPHKAYYREVTAWWNTELGELSVEEPDATFGLHVVILRRKLRLIWLLSSSRDETETMHRIDQLSTHHYRTYCLGLRERNEARLKRLSAACHWLRRNVEKLRVCENPTCERMTTYFLRRENNTKYCSKECFRDAEEAAAQAVQEVAGGERKDEPKRNGTLGATEARERIKARRASRKITKAETAR